MRIHNLFFALVLSLTVMNHAFAKSPENLCKDEARDDRNQCVRTCQQTFQQTKSACDSTDPTCAKNCVDVLRACNNAIEDVKEDCVDQCRDTFDTARDACKDQCKQNVSSNKGKGNNREFGLCMTECLEPAALARFRCSATCRINFRTDLQIKQALEACRTNFVTCKNNCKVVAPTPTPG